MASLWIRRFKPREELDSLKGETLVSDNGTLQGLHAGNSDAGGSMHSFGSHLQGESSTKTWGNEQLSKIRKLDGKDAALNGQIYSSKRQSYGAETQQNLNLFAKPHTSGKQRNQIADEEKLPMTRCTSEAAMPLHTHIQAAESKSQVLHAVRMQAAEVGILTSSLGKPPLPPSHKKAGLPPRSAGGKFSSFLARSAGKISSSSPTNSELVQDIGRHPSHTALMREGLPAPIDLTGPLLKEGPQAEGDSIDCQGPFLKENGMCIETRRVHPSTQIAKSESFSQKVVLQQDGMCRSEGTYPSLLAKPPKKITRQDFEAIDVIASGAESSKKLHGLEIKEPASGTLLKEGNMLKTPSEIMVVSRQENQSTKATESGSTSSRFPWEMFAGAAAPTRIARDEFVEVYNRARNELKSQKSSSSVGKLFYKEMENSPNFAFQDTVIVQHEGQPLDGQRQQEIPGKQHKFEGLDCVAQHEGLKVTANCPHVPQKEQLLEKHNCASFLDGDADISPEKNLQACQNVHGMCGEESSSFMQHGQDGGPPAAVGQKDFSSTFDKSLRCRQGFEGAASTHRKPLQAARQEQADRVQHDNAKTLLRLGKRQLGMFNSGPGIIPGKESFQCVTPSRKSKAWLQRWYSPYITSINGSQEYKLFDFEVLGQDLAAGNKLMAEESHEHKACVKEAFKRRLIEKGVLYQRIMAGGQPECSKASSEKVLPSAAAMAIVGSAARHFCVAEPQQKGSFSFWSGFGTQTSQTQEHFTEQRKRKLTFEVDPSA